MAVAARGRRGLGGFGGREREEEAEERGERLMSAPPFEHAGEFITFPGEVAFRRRSCCLYYRVAAGGKCGDCPLVK